jgi:hypothetical protein
MSTTFLPALREALGEIGGFDDASDEHLTILAGFLEEASLVALSQAVVDIGSRGADAPPVMALPEGANAALELGPLAMLVLVRLKTGTLEKAGFFADAQVHLPPPLFHGLVLLGLLLLQAGDRAAFLAGVDINDENRRAILDGPLRELSLRVGKAGARYTSSEAGVGPGTLLANLCEAAQAELSRHGGGVA